MKSFGQVQAASMPICLLEPEVPLDLGNFRAKVLGRQRGSRWQNLRKVTRMPEMHRPYIAGDPPQRIDWRAYARTDQLYLREVHEEASARVTFVIDCGETMFWPDPATQDRLPRAMSKWELSLRLAFTFMGNFLRSSDMVTCYFGQLDQPLKKLNCRTSDDLTMLWQGLKQDRFALNTMDSQATGQQLLLSEISHLPMDHLFILSDLLCLGSMNIPDFVLPSEKLVLLHVLSIFETNIDWLNDATFYFPTNTVSHEYLGRSVKKPDYFKSTLQTWQTRLKKWTEDAGGTYLNVNDETPVADIQGVLDHFDS